MGGQGVLKIHVAGVSSLGEVSESEKKKGQTDRGDILSLVAE